MCVCAERSKCGISSTYIRIVFFLPVCLYGSDLHMKERVGRGRGGEDARQDGAFPDERGEDAIYGGWGASFPRERATWRGLAFPSDGRYARTHHLYPPTSKTFDRSSRLDISEKFSIFHVNFPYKSVG